MTVTALKTSPKLGVGASFKPQHFAAILESTPDIGFFEVHAENYMGAGGPPHAQLGRLRRDYALSVHGVGLSIGGTGPLDRGHLARLKGVVDRYEPALVSEHLAWSGHRAAYLNDLLALPYTNETLHTVVANVTEVQETLGRPILLENPSTYVRFTENTWDEADFINAAVRRSGCGLLLDVNNVHVSAVNHGFDAGAYLSRLPLDAVGEIHLAGHAEAVDDGGERFLIDDHGGPPAESVLDLFAAVLTRTGPVPALIEWDTGVPAWATLLHEVRRVEQAHARPSGVSHVA